MPETTKCWNYRINLLMCPCTYEGCPNKGLCCECMRNHWGNKEYPAMACMRGATRPPETMGLPKATTIHCWSYEKNRAMCPCQSKDCARKGTCCDCVRNHWVPNGKPTACMRGVERPASTY